MKIAFDFDAVIKHRYSGFYTYGMGLLSGFSELPDPPEVLLFCSLKNVPHIPDRLRGCPNIQVRTTRLKIRHLQNLWSFSPVPSLQMFTGEFDLYHSIHHLMPPTRECPRLLTVHDLRRYRLPELYSGSKLHRFENALRRADHIVTVSKATRNDLREIFHIPPERIDVVHPAVNKQDTLPSADEKKLARETLARLHSQPMDRLILAFSSPDRRKNITRIIRAFDSARPSLPPGTVLCVIGTLPRNDPELDRLLQVPHESLVLTGNIPSVREYLTAADAMVFASLYEGFGLPILEAFQAACPVITSNVSSMPEVAGKAALLVDPNNSISIAQALAKLLNDAALQERLIKAGREHLVLFDWKITARKMTEVYRKLLA